jgi:hypothetical protein
MANTILTPTAVTREALRILHNNLAFTRGVDRQYDDSFAKSGAKIGDSLKIRLPNRYKVRTGKTIDAQDTSETSVTLQVATQKGVDINFSSAELTLDLDDFSERILKPAMARLASEVDFDGLTEIYRNTWNQVGTPGTTPATALVHLQAGQKLDEFTTPRDDYRYMCLNPAAQAATVNGLSGLFNSTDRISEQYKNGMMGQGLGFMFGMDQNINTHTTGAFAGTTLVDDTVVEGDAVITVDAFTDAAPTVKQGDIFTIAGVNAVNPETGQDTGSLQQFVVTADTTGASNEINIPVSPAFKASATDATRTITALPADGAAVTFAGTASTAYPINIAHHKEAITLATADLVMPRGVDFAAREVMDGISMRIARQWDIVNDNFPCRIDILYGWQMLRPEFSCRVIG